MNSIDRTKQVLKILSALCLVYIISTLPAYAQPKTSELIERAKGEFDNGNYTEAIEIAVLAGNEAKNRSRYLIASQSFDIIACSQISLAKFSEAEVSLNQSLQSLPDSPRDSFQKALIYIHFAWLYRFQHKFDKSLEFSKKALSISPGNTLILGEYYLNLGRIFFMKGFDVAAIVWLEKAEKLFENEYNIPAKLDVLRFLSLSWQAKLSYPNALAYAQKLVSIAEKTPFKYKYRQSLLDLASILSATGQKEKNFEVLKKGLKISIEQNNSFHTNVFLSQLLLNSLYDNDLVSASDYLIKLEKNEKNNDFSFNITLGKAIIAAFNNELETSENLFAKLEREDTKKKLFFILYWKITIAEKFHDWNKVIALNQQLLEVALKNNFREDLPGIFLTFAKAYFNLRQKQMSEEYLEKTLAYIEDIRKSDNVELSVNLFETYHNAYRLYSEIKEDIPEKAFELSDFLKSRLLKDKINNSLLDKDNNLLISPKVRQRIEELSLQSIIDKSIESEIGNTEREITRTLPELNILKLNLTGLNEISALNDAAIISYQFTIDKKLLAFVWQKDKPLQSVYIPIDEEETNKIASETYGKIKQFIFFKQDGKAIFDKFLKPLSIQAKHLIIIPDKSLWKIPFQALSEDGKTYLIEHKTISYAPSVSILLNQLNAPKPDRRTFQVFSNDLYGNLYLKFANAEALSLAKIYNTQPNLNSTVTTFKALADKSDILHLSMHAEIDPAEPFNSFLAFRQINQDNGRLTVGELLKMKLKKRSLVFLASCDTNNVFEGEGLVSLSWGMMGAGASTVISAQWEANDKSTELFSKAFYKYYKQGLSSAEAMQKASLEMINNTSNNLSEPYQWAEFTLTGDYR